MRQEYSRVEDHEAQRGGGEGGGTARTTVTAYALQTACPAEPRGEGEEGPCLLDANRHLCTWAE